MDILLGLFVGFLMFVLPFMIAGAIVFGVVFSIGFMLSRIAARDGERRKKIVGASAVAGIILAVLLCIPIVGKTYSHFIAKKERPARDFHNEFFEQIKGDGRDKYWPAGTITNVEHWLDQANKKFRDKAHKELAAAIAGHITDNTLATNDSDLVFIASLANLPANSYGYSDGVVASARAYIRIKDIGYADIGYPERFARSPGHHGFAAQMDYVAYLRLLMQRCVDAPDAMCREVFSPDYLAGLERVPYYPLEWLELRESLPPLRAALGYPRGKEDH